MMGDARVRLLGAAVTGLSREGGGTACVADTAVVRRIVHATQAGHCLRQFMSTISTPDDRWECIGRCRCKAAHGH